MLSNFRFAAGRIVPIRLVYGVACWLTLSLTSTVFGQEEVLSEVAPPTGDSVRAEAILEDLHSAPSGVDSETLVVGTQDVPDGAESTRPAPPQDDVTSFFAQTVKARSAFEKLQLQQQIQRLVYTMQSMSTQLEGMEKLQNQRSGMKLPSQEKLQHTSEEFGRALKEYLAELKTELERPETGRFPEISAAQAAQNAQIQSFFQQQQRAEEKAAAAMKAARERQVESMELLKREQDAMLKSNRMAFERARELAAPSEKDLEFLRRQLQLQHEREQRKLKSEGQAFEPSQMFRPSPTPVHPLPGKPIVAPERLEQLESRLERIESLLERLLQDKIPLKKLIE